MKAATNIAEALQPLAVPIGLVKPDPRNARLHPQPNLDALKRSLTAYGQRKPIVVNAKTMTIEAGNGLWQAARELGWPEVAAVLVDDDGVTAQAYALMDNKSALMADWDLPRLKDILQELDTGAFEMDLTGFLEAEIEDLMTQFHEVPSKTLVERFLVPPFSVLDARQGYWQKRKAAWLALGIRSELGRGEK